MSDLSLIQDNIRSMIDQAAPESDINAYLKTAGHTPASFAKSNAMAQPVSNEDPGLSAMGAPGVSNEATPGQQNSAMSPVNTVVNTLGTGLTKGINAVSGAPSAMGDLNASIANWAGNKVGAPETGAAVGEILRHAVPGFGMLPRPEDLNKGIFGTGVAPEVNAADNPALTLTPPMLNGGKVNLGSLFDAGIQAVPGMMAAGGAVLPGFMGGVTSDLAGQATHGTPWEPLARVLGGFPGYYGGAKLTTPLPANLSPQQAKAVELAKNMEPPIPLSVAQETGRGQGLERLLSRMPGGMGISERFAAKQGAAADEAALATVGYKGNELGQETMKGVARQAGDEFAAAKNMPGVVDLTPTFPDVRGAVAKYENVMDPARRSPAVGNEAARILSKETGPVSYPPPTAAEAVSPPAPTLGNLTTAIKNASKPIGEAFDALPDTNIKAWFGEKPSVAMTKAPPELSNPQYQTLRKGLNEAIDSLYGAQDTNGAKALQAMRTSLDNAAEASLGPDKLAAWKQAREHYFNFKVLEKAMNNGTASARSEGTLGAGALDRALKSKQGDAYYRTTGGLNDVATVKGYLRDTFPNSGSPQILAQAAALLNPLTGGAIGAAVNTGQRAMTGGYGLGWLRNYLANQSIPNQGMSQLPQSSLPGLLQLGPQLPAIQMGPPRLPERGR